MTSLEAPRRIDELEAVNIILKNSGELTVSSIGSFSKPSAQKARDMLAEESVRIQSDGWNFCTEPNLTLTPNPTTSEIVLPVNILSFHPVGRSEWMRVLDDGGRLYDADRASFKFKTDVTVSAVLARPFASLPQPARWFITVSAALRYAASENPGGNTVRLTADDLAKAEASLKKFDRRLRKGGLRIHNPHFKRLRGRR